MSNKNKETSFIHDFAIVRDLIYHFFLYGFKPDDESNKLKYSQKMFNNYSNKISAFINEDKHVLEKKDGRKKIISYKMDSYTLLHNYLCKAYSMSSEFTANVAGQIVLVMQLLNKNQSKSLSITAIQTELENLPLNQSNFKAFVNDGKGYGAIPRLIKLNLIKNISSNKISEFKSIDNPLSEITSSGISPVCFLDFISLCRNITPPYTAGNMMFESAFDFFKADKSVQNYKTPFIIKGDFFSQVLDDNIFYDIIKIINTKSSALIKYNRTDISDPIIKTIKVYPVKIVSNNVDGRRYLFAWDIEYKKSIFMRLDKINSISGTNEGLDSLKEDIDFEKEFLTATKHSINGTTLLNNETEDKKPCKITISFIGSTENDGNEDFKRHVTKMFNDSEFTKTEANLYSGDIYVNTFNELKPWLRSNVGYVKLTDSSSEFTNEMENEIKEWKKLYGII